MVSALRKLSAAVALAAQVAAAQPAAARTSAPKTAGTRAAGTRAAVVAPIQVGDAWSRPAMAGLPTAVVYMTLTNHGGAPDRLEGASTPKAARASLHRSQMTAGVMSMLALPDGLELPPGRVVALSPGGYHLMLDGLRGGLQAGRSYPVTLRFAHAKPETITVQVRGGADPMAAMPMPGGR